MNVWDTHRWIGSSSGRSVKIYDKLHQHLFCVTCGRNFITDPVCVEFQFRRQLGSEISLCNVAARNMTQVLPLAVGARHSVQPA